MRKVIKYSVYDTDKARKIGQYKNLRYSTDFVEVLETLYQSRSGKYFVHAKAVDMDGNLEDGMAVLFANKTPEPQRIFPLSAEQAKHYAQEKLSEDEYKKLYSIYGR